VKLEGSVALVVGADSAVGAAIVRGLLTRDAVKVYAAASESGGGRPQPGAVPLTLNLARPAHAGALARELADVNLLVNCMVAVQHSASSLAGSAIQPLGRRLPPVGRTLNLINAFAPVLAANGGGAVANVLSVLYVDQPLDDSTPTARQGTVDWMLADGLRGRLAAQQTQLLYFRAQLAVGSRDQVLDDQRALAGHVAMRVLDRLEAGDRPDEQRLEVAGRNHAHSVQSGQETNE
jgi:NAD(P)-dependent dehydrogenase (short-subunit alcohol dehydrogenase family)